MPKAPSEPKVLFSDNHLLVVVKPCGMLSQADRTLHDSLLDWGKRYIKEIAHKPGEVYLGLVHRLDRPAGGVMVFARTSKAAGRLSAAFRDRRVDKRYWALTEVPPEPANGTLRDGLIPGVGTTATRVVAPESRDAQTGVLHYDTLGTTPRGTLVAVELETGRKHQIRAQLAHAGAPILGDSRYGAQQTYRRGGIALWAYSLTIPHPIGGEPRTFRAPPPDDWQVPESLLLGDG